MGVLDFFGRAKPQPPQHLRGGSFTLDATGRIIASTLPQQFPVEQAQEIGQQVLTAFRSAREARLPLKEFNVSYATFKISARELNGGAILFLSSRTTA